ncbi:hypothetical protein EDD17DRAFT_1763629 [Pisolithus thermaeus]|nr:hypothetical protein EDD17DRAFT_1763629 [Pisolithus thermaeus]
MARLMYISPPHSAVVPQYEYQLSPPSSAVLDRPSLSSVGFSPTLFPIRNPRAGLVQGGSARAEPDALSQTPVATVGQTLANVAVHRPPSVKHRPTSAKLRILPAASLLVAVNFERGATQPTWPALKVAELTLAPHLFPLPPPSLLNVVFVTFVTFVIFVIIPPSPPSFATTTLMINMYIPVP